MNENQNLPETQENQKTKEIVVKKKHLVIALILFIVLVVVIILSCLSCNSCITCQPLGNITVYQQTSSTEELDVDPNAGDYNGNQPKSNGSEADSIKVPGYPSITIPANTENVSVALLNPKGNPCYFTFEIVLKDTGESLYKSKLVPPGKAITNIDLAHPLSEGEYEAVIKVSTTSLKDQTPMNGANIETVLIAK